MTVCEAHPINKKCEKKNEIFFNHINDTTLKLVEYRMMVVFV